MKAQYKDASSIPQRMMVLTSRLVFVSGCTLESLMDISKPLR